MMPCIVLPVSRPPNVTEKTACTQMKGGIPRYVFSTSSPLFDIGEPKYRQNNPSHLICTNLCLLPVLLVSVTQILNSVPNTYSNIFVKKLRISNIFVTGQLTEYEYRIYSFLAT